jgi:glycosyltransferase involved in cell wall biosynthesis
MNILHISTSDFGGAGMAAIRLHHALLKNGIESSFLSLTQNKNDIKNSFFYDAQINKINQAPAYPQLNLSNYFKERFFHTFDKQLLDFKKQKAIEDEHYKQILEDRLSNKFELFSSPCSKYDITETTAYKNSDIIHLHWVADFLDYPSFFAKNTKPVVWTLHDENPFRGGFHYEADEIGNKNDYGELDIQYKKVKLDSIIHAQKLTVISPSNWLAHNAKSSKAFNKYNVTTIANTLDTRLFSPKNKSFCREYLSLPVDKTIFLFASQSTSNKRKGFDLLESLLNKNEFNNAHFIILGDNKHNKQDQRFHFLGHIGDELLLPLIYSAADAFILPSREDNLPNTMLESLCCGTPVISFSVGGMKEELETGVNGILCGDISEENLKQGILDFINGRYHFNNQKISEQAHLKYAEEHIAKMYMDVYQELFS